MNDSMNLSKTKRQNMLKFLEVLKNTNNDDKSIRAINEIENFLTNKKYGLVWENHQENVDIDLETKIPVFNEKNDFDIINSDKNEYNFLLEGDNLHSLCLLEKTHKDRIDLIYIDPPYNTGNKDFKYNDTFISKEDDYRHSKWMSFMYRRLNIANKLLKEDGLICISIDDNELYQLKLLCDEIFGEENFIANIVVETANGVFGTRASQAKKTIVKVKDYVLVYAKNKDKITRDFNELYMPTNDLFDTHYSIVLDKDLNKYNFLDYLKNDNWVKKIFEKYDTSLSLSNIAKVMRIDKDFNDYIIKNASNIYQDVAYSLKTPEELEPDLNSGKIVRYKNCILFKTKNGDGTIRQYVSFKDSLRNTDEYVSEYKKAVVIGDLWEGFDADMKNVSKEGDCEFSNGKKPVRLIKQLIKWANIPNGIILDFFAGSGTTGQAVIDLNKEDNGNRKFILCTNNEVSSERKLEYLHDNNIMIDYNPSDQVQSSVIDSKIEKYFKDKNELYNKLFIENNLNFQKYGICQYDTLNRLKTVITGKKQNNSNYSNGFSTNLKYYQTDWVERKPIEYFLQPQLCKHIKEMIELDNMINVDDKEYIIILNKQDFINKFVKNTNKTMIKRIWINEELILNDIEWLSLREYVVKYIPRIYFSNELREVGE